MATSAPVNRLNALPPELLIKVLEVLPVRQTCQLRVLSTQFRDFIDKNDEAIALHTFSSHRKRLLTRLYWLTDLEDLDLIDILDRYCSYYGEIDVHSSDGRGSNIFFGVMLVESSRGKLFRGLSEAEKLITGLTVLDFFWQFKNCHNYIHLPSQPTFKALYAEMQRAATKLEATAAKLKDPVSNIKYLRARLQDGKLLRGPHYTDRHGVPHFPITARHGLPYFGCPTFLQNCDTLLMNGVFALPSPLKSVGYCVKTKGMQKMVWEACTARDPRGTELFQSCWRLTALMEEMFLF